MLDVPVEGQQAVLADDVDLAELAERTEGYVGADIEAVCREAAQVAVREHVRTTAAGDASPVDELVLTADHFERALETVEPQTGAFDAGDEQLVAGDGGDAMS